MKYVVVLKAFDKRIAEDMAEKGDWAPLKDYVLENSNGRYPDSMVEMAVDRLTTGRATPQQAVATLFNQYIK